jgi:hypothetical protein
LIGPEITLPSHWNDDRIKEQERDDPCFRHGGRGRVRFIASKFRRSSPAFGLPIEYRWLGGAYCLAMGFLQTTWFIPQLRIDAPKLTQSSMQLNHKRFPSSSDVLAIPVDCGFAVTVLSPLPSGPAGDHASKAPLTTRWGIETKRRLGQWTGRRRPVSFRLLRRQWRWRYTASIIETICAFIHMTGDA